MAEKAQDKPQPSGRPAPAAMRKMASGPVWAAKKSEDRRPRTPEEPLVAAATYPHIAAEPMERERERESETVEVAVDKANSKADEMPGDQMKEAGENSGAVGELDSSDVHAAEASAQQSLELNVPSDAEEVAEMFPVATVALDKANSESDEMPGGQMNEAGENFVALGELDGSDGPQEVAGMDSAATVALDKASWAAVFCHACTCAGPFLPCVVLAISGACHVTRNEADDTFFLDSAGIGCTVWAFLFLVLAVTWIGRTEKGEEHVFANYGSLACVPSERGSLDSASIRDRFIHDMHIRFCKTVCFLGQVAFNGYFITQIFVTLPPRDPHEQMNFARHMVSWVEFSAFWVIFFAGMLSFLGGVLCTRESYLSYVCLRCVHSLGKCSVLRSLPMASPFAFWDKLQAATAYLGRLGFGEHLSLARLIPMLLLYGLLVWCAVLAVLMKIVQLDFVTDRLYTEWSFGSYISLCGVLNNLATMSSRSVKDDAILMFKLLSLHEPDACSGWLRDLWSTTCGVLGVYGAFIVFSTLSVDDIAWLLNSNNRT